MWNNFGDFQNLTKKLAEKAAAAAENIEGQLNESVGATPEVLSAASNKLGSNDVNASRSADLSVVVDDEDPFGEDDDFYADDDSFDIDMHDNTDPTKTRTENEIEDEPVVQEPPPEHTVENDDSNPTAEASVPEPEPQSESEPQLQMYELGPDPEPEPGSMQQATGESGKDIPIEETTYHQDDNSIDIQDETLYDDSDEEDEEIEFDSAVEIPTGDKTAEYPLKLERKHFEAASSKVLKVELLQDTPLHRNQVIEEGESENVDIAPDPSLVTDQVIEYKTVASEFPEGPAGHEEEVLNMKVEDTVDALDPIEAVHPQDDPLNLPPDHDEDISLNPIGDDDEDKDISSDLNGIHSEHPNTIRLKAPRSYDEDEESVYVSKEEALGNSFEMGTLKSQIEQLERELQQRKNQLESKAIQITTMVELHEKEKKVYETKLKETKDEAKKRISKAKEKVDEYKNKVAEANARANSVGSESNDQEKIIAALREEGQNLARKQSEMEHLVREARLDMRDLKKELESERSAKEKAQARIIDLESELKETKEDLKAAKQKGGLAEKLDSDLLAAREEREKNASIILGLEAKLKESKSRNNELQKEMEEEFKSKVAHLEQESASIRNEKDTILRDLESKLRTSERESNLREDSLRHEVGELRKRWQDAVRRCDALSIDLQQSSAPLMRQLESTERQNRARAAAWAELESKLRQDLEDNIFENEKLMKDKNEMEAELKKSSRSLAAKESELMLSLSRVEEMSKDLAEVSQKLEKTHAEHASLILEFSNLEKTMKDNESSQNLDMINTIQAIEERCNDQVDSLEVELRQERDKRTSLETKLQEMMDRTSQLVHIPSNENRLNGDNSKSRSRNLGSKTNQANILQETLLGLDIDDGDEDQDERNGINSDQLSPDASDSFAFMEQLTQALKATKSERDTLRKQLEESEERRGVLENESVANQEAIKALPSLEARLSQQTREVMEKDMEIQALQEDINEVRSMYRSQLSALLDAGGNGPSNGIHINETIAPQIDTKPEPSPTSFGGMRTF